MVDHRICRKCGQLMFKVFKTGKMCPECKKKSRQIAIKKSKEIWGKNKKKRKRYEKK